MLDSLHILLTYQCLNECDHCFLCCGPAAAGTFSPATVVEALDQAVAAGVEGIEVEGGEPFLHYPLLLETLRLARQRGLKRGVVTNGYWATSPDGARLWLEPLAEIGLDSLAVSDDGFHGSEAADSPAKLALRAAAELGLPVGSICIDGPDWGAAGERERGEAVVGGSVVLKGRAVDTLAADLPSRPFEVFSECTQEDLASPGRVHLDPFGHVFVCQGLSIGNVRQKPLARIMAEYRPEEHPVIGPLLAGGPAELARRYGLPEGGTYASDCHLCFLVRRSLLERYPESLCPPQVYGVG